MTARRERTAREAYDILSERLDRLEGRAKDYAAKEKIRDSRALMEYEFFGKAADLAAVKAAKRAAKKDDSIGNYAKIAENYSDAKPTPYDNALKILSRPKIDAKEAYSKAKGRITGIVSKIRKYTEKVAAARGAERLSYAAIPA